MSSFVCSDRHFNCMESAFNQLTGRNGIYSIRNWDRPKLKAFVDTLFNLNYECVCAQYAENREVFERFRTQVKSLTIIELLKAVNCLKYQCELDQLQRFRELTGAETTAWKLLEDIRQELMAKIIHETAAYQRGDWEIRD